MVDYLLLGHITKDLTPEGHRLGGTVAYSGRLAQAMGLQVGVVSAAASDIDLSPLDGLCLHVVLSPETTTFENSHVAGMRRQRIHARARPLEAGDVPERWRLARLVHMAPVADELPLDLAKKFPSAAVFATPQGWLRQWDKDGYVTHHPWYRLLPALAGVRAAVLGWEDIAWEAQAAQALAEALPILVLTSGASGADLFRAGKRIHIDAPPAQEVDPTGAGDVFAAAFFIGLGHGDDCLVAARRAARVAAISVTAPGLAGIPSPDQLASLQAATA